MAIFTYDFTSATSASSKMNQETKHIYILQNALKKSFHLSKKYANFTIPSEATINRTHDLPIEDRLGDVNVNESFMEESTTSDMMPAESRITNSLEPEMRAQNLHNFKHRKRVLKSIEDERENEEPDGKQFDNHAIVYRVRQR